MSDNLNDNAIFKFANALTSYIDIAGAETLPALFQAGAEKFEYRIPCVKLFALFIENQDQIAQIDLSTFSTNLIFDDIRSEAKTFFTPKFFNDNLIPFKSLNEVFLNKNNLRLALYLAHAIFKSVIGDEFLLIARYELISILYFYFSRVATTCPDLLNSCFQFISSWRVNSFFDKDTLALCEEALAGNITQFSSLFELASLQIGSHFLQIRQTLLAEENASEPSKLLCDPIMEPYLEALKQAKTKYWISDNHNAQLRQVADDYFENINTQTVSATALMQSRLNLVEKANDGVAKMLLQREIEIRKQIVNERAGVVQSLLKVFTHSLLTQRKLKSMQSTLLQTINPTDVNAETAPKPCSDDLEKCLKTTSD